MISHFAKNLKKLPKTSKKQLLIEITNKFDPKQLFLTINPHIVCCLQMDRVNRTPII